MSEPTAVFNPTRLDLARRRRGLDSWDLADALRLSVPTVRRYLRGERVPNAPTIACLAELLRFPPAFFFGPTLDEPPKECL